MGGGREEERGGERGGKGMVGGKGVRGREGGFGSLGGAVDSAGDWAARGAGEGGEQVEVMGGAACRGAMGGAGMVLVVGAVAKVARLVAEVAGRVPAWEGQVGRGAAVALQGESHTERRRAAWGPGTPLQATLHQTWIEQGGRSAKSHIYTIPLALPSHAHHTLGSPLTCTPYPWLAPHMHTSHT